MQIILVSKFREMCYEIAFDTIPDQSSCKCIEQRIEIELFVKSRNEYLLRNSYFFENEAKIAIFSVFMGQKQQLTGFVNLNLIYFSVWGFFKWNMFFHNYFYKGEFVLTPKKAIFISFQRSMANHSATLEIIIFLRAKKGQINH